MATTKTLMQAIDGLREAGLADVAANAEAVDLLVTALRALTRAHFTQVLDGSAEQADIVLRLLPALVQPVGGADAGMGPDDLPDGYNIPDPGEPPTR